MKKLTTLVLAALGFTSLFGQSTSTDADTPDVQQVHIETSTPVEDYRTRGNAIWSEDFANGFPSTWTRVDTASTGGASAPWVHSFDGSWGQFSQGQTMSAAPAITSTTAANGFLIVDADSANHFSFGQPSGSTYEYISSYFQTDVIDLSAHANVILEFEQDFRKNNTIDLIVGVSGDGTTWTNYTVQGGVANNAASGLQTISLDISSVAGLSATAYVRIGWSARVYYWMIDDMRIIPSPDYNRSLLYSIISHSNDSYEYAAVPQTQLNTDITLGMYARNNGVLDQTNVALSADVANSGGTSVINSGTTFAAVAQYDTAFFLNTEPTSSLSPDVYDITFAYTSDQDGSEPDLTDDGESRKFEVTDGATGIYALDGLDVYDNPSLTSFGTGSFADASDGFMCFTLFKIANNATFTGADAVINTNGTAVGGEYQFQVFNAADVQNGNFDFSFPVAQSAVKIVTADDISNGVLRAEFSSPANLAPGDYQLGIVMSSFANTSDITIIDDVTVPQPPDASQIFIPASSAQSNVYTNGNAFAIRLSQDPTIGIDEQLASTGVGLGNCYPNPSEGMVTIPVELLNRANVLLVITDITGKIVLSENQGKLQSGNHLIELDLRTLSEGVYNYTLQADGTQYTKRLTLTK